MLDRRIDTFLTLCKTMHYRAASELLHITQPAVTQHIQYLEQYYNCRLFVYDGRRLTKTPQAALIERSLHAMRYQEERLLDALLPRPGAHLAIGATKTIGEFVIAEQVARFLADSSNNLSVCVDNTAQILSLLDGGELDFAIVEGYFDRSLYESRLYRAEPFVGLCGAQHPFVGKTVPMEALWRENLVIREEGSGTRDILAQHLRALNHSMDDFAKVTCINNFGLLTRLLASGCGVTFAYAAVAAHADGVAVFRVDSWDITQDFNYVYLKDCSAEGAIALFDSFRTPPA